MTTFLDLPRELYLMVCAYLKPTELTQLAGVSRDHYLAVQQPLYLTVTLTRYSALIRLVDTLRKIPVVSTISPQQRLRWFKLSDEQLRERNIKRLNLTLSSEKDGHRITGVVLSNCIGAISRNCSDVAISLTLIGGWPNFISQLDRFGLPNVTELDLVLASFDLLAEKSMFAEAQYKIWDLIFSGSSFADLKKVRLRPRNSPPPSCIYLATGTAAPVRSYSWEEAAAPQSKAIIGPFYGLRRMEAISLESTSYFSVEIMTALFASDIIPTNLTRLEIADCESLHPVKHLPAIATLLQRALQLVTHLKLHFCKLHHFETENPLLDSQYNARIKEHPEEHPCNIIREFGHRIQHLDIALPFICQSLLMKPNQKVKPRIPPRDYPSIPYEPAETLAERVQAEGYRHKRVISWHWLCRGSGNWQDFADTAQLHGGMKESWEILYPAENVGIWVLSGHAAVTMDGREVLTRSLEEVTE